MWIDQRIIENSDNLTKNDLDLLEEIRKFAEKVPQLSIAELSNILHVSQSTIVRLSQRLGFKGYSEFKYHFSLNQDEIIKHSSEDLRELLKQDIQSTIKLAENTNFSTLVNQIIKARIIYCYGTGLSQKKALEEFGRLLMDMNKQVIIVPVQRELSMMIPMVSNDDLFIICSLTGNTNELKTIVPELKKREIPLVGISEFSQNYLSNSANLSYYFYSSGFYDNSKISRISLTGLTILLDWIYRECQIEIMKKI